MRMETKSYLPAIKNYIDKMPSLPTTVTKILEISNDPRTSPADLNKVISLDPVLMGKVLKLINSAYYGLSQEITSLVRAIIMLGINTVKNLALSTAILGSVGKTLKTTAINPEGFWRHSLCTGVTAKLVAKMRKVDTKRLEEYFVAGLLHDIGKIPLNNRLTENYLMAIAVSDRENKPIVYGEEKALGFNHCDVGRIIVERWKLGKEIADSILFHHKILEYTGDSKDILYTIVLSNYFANTA